jgi:hypothetical protein
MAHTFFQGYQIASGHSKPIGPGKSIYAVTRRFFTGRVSFMFHPRLEVSATVALACFLLLSSASAAIIHVDDSAPPGGNGSSWPLAFDDLQDALVAAAAFDEIHVAEGIYLPSKLTTPLDSRSAAFVMIDDVGLYGGYAGFGAANPDERDVAAYTTILSGDLNVDDVPGYINRSDNCYHVVFNDGNGLSETAVLDGFTLSGGYADVATQYNSGGGIFLQSSSPTLNDCIFTDNWAINAAGVSIVTASPVLNRCAIVDNLASNIGGGVIVSNGPASLNACLISGNQANLGGGMSSFTADSTLIDCVFAGNVGVNEGGGMHNLDSSPTLTDCAFVDNSGGAMLNDLNSGPLLKRCVFIGNSAWENGGAIANLGSSPTLVNCILKGNMTDKSGGAIFNSFSSPGMFNCTFVENSAAVKGGAISDFSSSSPVLTNCILWDNRAGSPPLANSFHSDSSSAPVVTFCAVENGYAGAGNIDADPLFAGPADGDTHLTWNSPCRDSGSNAAVADPLDVEEDPRVVFGTVDMGADEFYFHLYHVGAVAPGSLVAIKVVGVPGFPVLLALGKGIRNPPLPTPYGDLRLKLPLAMTWNLGAIPGTGVKSVTAAVPPGWQAGFRHPFQALVGPQGGATTRLTNLMTLTTE